MFPLNIRNKCSLTTSNPNTLPNDLIAMIFGYVGISTPEELEYLRSLGPLGSKDKYLKYALGTNDIKDYIDIMTLEDDDLRASLAVQLGKYDVLLNMIYNDIKLRDHILINIFKLALDREDYDLAKQIYQKSPQFYLGEPILMNLLEDNNIPAYTAEQKSKLYRKVSFLIDNFDFVSGIDMERDVADVLSNLIGLGWFDLADKFIVSIRGQLDDPYFGWDVIVDNLEFLPLLEQTITDNVDSFNANNWEHFHMLKEIFASHPERAQQYRDMLIRAGVNPGIVDNALMSTGVLDDEGNDEGNNEE